MTPNVARLRLRLRWSYEVLEFGHAASAKLLEQFRRPVFGLMRIAVGRWAGAVFFLVPAGPASRSWLSALAHSACWGADADLNGCGGT